MQHQFIKNLQYSFFTDFNLFQESSSFLSFFVDQSELKEGVVPSFAFLTSIQQITSAGYPNFICLLNMKQLLKNDKHHRTAVFFSDFYKFKNNSDKHAFAFFADPKISSKTTFSFITHASQLKGSQPSAFMCFINLGESEKSPSKVIHMPFNSASSHSPNFKNREYDPKLQYSPFEFKL